MTGFGTAAPWQAWLVESKGWHMIDEIDLVGLIALQSDWLRVCARLEQFADRLPAELPPCEAATCCAELRRLANVPQDAFTQRANRLFLTHGMGDPLARSLIRHVASQHAARIDHVYDLIEALEPGATAPSRIDADTLGYMLRCFFAGCRQTVALERLSLLDLGGDRLTAGARMLLADRIIECCEAG